MKVIHTFSSGTGGGTVSFNLMANAIVSAMYAKAHYGRVELYASLPAYRSFENCFGDDLPYDKIHILDDSEEKIVTWSVPKIEVYEKQKDPYLHIDLDTVMYNKLNFEDRNLPVLFSHVDMPLNYKNFTFQESFNEMIVRGELGLPSPLAGLYETYLRFFVRTIDHYSSEDFKYFDCQHTPNMNFVYVEDPELVSKASYKALEVYRKYKTLFTSSHFSPCYVEQFLIHWYLRGLSTTYREASDQSNHVIFSQEPLMIQSKGAEEGNYLKSYNYLDINFNTLEDKLIVEEVNSREDVHKFITNKLGGFFHSTGYKSLPVVEANVLYAFQEVAGKDMLQKLHRFHLMHRFNDGAPFLSEGQKIYEDFIDKDFFDTDVEEFKNPENNLNFKLV